MPAQRKVRQAHRYSHMTSNVLESNTEWNIMIKACHFHINLTNVIRPAFLTLT
jgi:hypothetical protein